MAERSRHELDAGALEGLTELFAKLPREELEKLLRVFLTDAELRDVTQRYRILQLLSEGLPQRKIAQELQASLCNVTRGSRMMKEFPEVAQQLASFFKERK